MRIFVTGANGYIGSAVVEAAVAAGHDVVGLVRSGAAADRLRELGASAVVGDLVEPGSVREVVGGCDAVVHTAVGRNGQVTEDDHRAVTSMLSALVRPEAAFVLTSGLGVYAGTSAALVDEDTPLDRVVPPQQPRAALERLVLDAPPPLRAVVVRPAHVYGRGRSGLFTRLLLDASQQAGAGVYIGSGLGLFGTVHVADLARAYLGAVTDPAARGGFNVVGQHLPLRDVAAAMGFAVGADGRTRSLDADEATATFGPLAAALQGAPPVSTVRTTSRLGWTPQSPTLVHELTHGSLRRDRAGVDPG